MMFTLSGGNSAKTSYSLGVNKSIDEEVMPSNGSDIDRLKMHGSINTKIGSAVIDLKTYHSWGVKDLLATYFIYLNIKMKGLGIMHHPIGMTLYQMAGQNIINLDLV